MQGDFSDAVPFLKRPINLDGEYAGDVGFDPLVSSFSAKRDSLPTAASDAFPPLNALSHSGIPTLTHTLTFCDGSH